MLKFAREVILEVVRVSDAGGGTKLYRLDRKGVGNPRDKPRSVIWSSRCRVLWSLED